jgi:hypothetical protein
MRNRSKAQAHMERARWYDVQGAAHKADAHFKRAMFYGARVDHTDYDRSGSTDAKRHAHNHFGTALHRVLPVKVYITRTTFGSTHTETMHIDDITRLLREAYGREIQHVVMTSTVDACDYAISRSDDGLVRGLVTTINALPTRSKPKGLILFHTNEQSLRNGSHATPTNYVVVETEEDYLHRSSSVADPINLFRWTQLANMPNLSSQIAGAAALAGGAASLSTWPVTVGLGAVAAVAGVARSTLYRSHDTPHELLYKAFEYEPPLCRVFVDVTTTCEHVDLPLGAWTTIEEAFSRLLALAYGTELGGVEATQTLAGCDYAISACPGVMSRVEALPETDKPDGIILWATAKNKAELRAVVPAPGYVDMEPVGMQFDSASSSYMFQRQEGTLFKNTVHAYCRILKRLGCCDDGYGLNVPDRRPRPSRPCISCEPWKR